MLIAKPMGVLRDLQTAGGTCATRVTRVTRVTFDFQEGDGFGLRAGNLQGIFQAQSAQSSF